MKKLLAFFLCLSMLLGAVAFATELGTDAMEGQTTVSLTISPEDNEFVVVIPATAEIDPMTQKYEGQLILKSGWKLVSCNGLVVKIKSSANHTADYDFIRGDGDYWKMKNADGNLAYYAIHAKPAGESSWTGLDAYNNNGTGYKYFTKFELINVTRSSDNTVDTICDIRFKVTDMPTNPGVYTDVLTFAVTLK